MKSKTTIEVNGKRYDAVTGAVIGVASAPLVSSGRNIDGFFRSRTATASPAPSVGEKITVLVDAAPEPEPEPARQQTRRSLNHARAHAPQAAVVARVHVRGKPVRARKPAAHHTAVAINHTKHHVAQSSQTLIRTSVQRPAPSFLKQANTQSSLQHAVPSLIVPKASIATVDPTRLERAQGTARSPQIAHHASGYHALIATVAPLAVQPDPVGQPGDEPTNAPSPTPTNKPTDIFEQALMNATHFVDVHAHTRHFKKQIRHHIVSMAAGTMALVVIAGFAAYQNTPGLQFKVASIQAGVSTNMPNFKAAGFAYDGARAQNGKLTVGFSNVKGDYQLIQQTTNLSGSDVVQNISTTGMPSYKTLAAGDTTIYRFGNTSATWVANGMWYTVNGTGALTDAQIESLAQNI